MATNSIFSHYKKPNTITVMRPLERKVMIGPDERGPESLEKKPTLSIEKVADDMNQVLKKLRKQLKYIKTKDSFSDVIPEIEETFRNKNFNDSESMKSSPSKKIKSNPVVKSISKLSNQNSQSKNKINTNLSKGGLIKNASSRALGILKTRSSKASNSIAAVKKASNINREKENQRKSSHTTNCSRGEVKKSVSSKMSSHSKTKNVPKENSKVQVYPRSPISAETRTLQDIKKRLAHAMKFKKIFSVQGRFPTVRRCLLERGWIEKVIPNSARCIHPELYKLLCKPICELCLLVNHPTIGNMAIKAIYSKLLIYHQVDLYWGHNLNDYKPPPKNPKPTILNKYRKDVFSYTNKRGLCEHAKESHWYCFPGVASINYPRSFYVSISENMDSFKKNYYMTAAIGLLKWMVMNNITREMKVLSPSGKIPIKIFHFAVMECYKFLKIKNHEDIDETIIEAPRTEWEEFLDYFYKMVHIGNHFKDDNTTTTVDMIRKATFLLNCLKVHWPSLETDGYMNIWILKPSYGCRGNGIHISRTLRYIERVLNNNPNSTYVVQKYIERPLLIHNTKFDIRQWFLISGANPITIWMYKKCYLRFCSQTYNLKRLHEAIHITNNSIQSKYANTGNDVSIPHYNMWESSKFQSYLANIGYPKAFEESIYPGMKEAITAVVLMSQDSIEKRQNSFELYGADFLIDENFSPWLLEINSSPALGPTTPVTAHMCPKVQEDVIKVIVDYGRNKYSCTGDFEMIYKENAVVLPKNEKCKELVLKGTPISKNYFATPEQEAKMKTGSNHQTALILKYPSEIDLTKERLKLVGDEMKQTLQDLLIMVKQEKLKRTMRKNSSTNTIGLKQCNNSKSVVTGCPSIRCVTESAVEVNIINEYGSDGEYYADVQKFIQVVKGLKRLGYNKVLRKLMELIDSLNKKTN